MLPIGRKADPLPQSICSGKSSPLYKISGLAVMALTVAAVAMVILGHLKSHPLLLPGYCVLGTACLLDMFYLLYSSWEKCLFNKCKNPIPPPSSKITSSLQAPQEVSGFHRVDIVGNNIRIGSVIVEILPRQCVKLNEQDMERLGIQHNTHAFIGNVVYRALSSLEIPKGTIRMNDTQLIQVFGVEGRIPESAWMDGLIRPFRGPFIAAEALTITILDSIPPNVLVYDSTDWHAQLILQLQGHILKNRQIIEVALQGGYQFFLKVTGGIANGEYKQVTTQTSLQLESI